MQSVVSGAVDPDMFIVRRSTENNNFTILERKLGGKNHSIYLTPQNSIKSVDVPNEMQKLFCLNDDCLLKLCEIGIFIQEKYGESSRDIEWAIQNVINILNLIFSYIFKCFYRYFLYNFRTKSIYCNQGQ